MATVTFAPDWVYEPFHSEVMVWPDPNDQARFQLLIGSPRLVIVTLAPNPPCHWLLTVYAT